VTTSKQIILHHPTPNVKEKEMKVNKVSALSLLTLMSISSFAMAAYNGPQGQGTMSVAQLKNLADDSWVTLEGRLIQYLGDDNYIFRDASGQVKVEVDQDVWRGVNVGPNDLIRIYGELDHNWNRAKVDVESLTKISGASQSKEGFSRK
jgi:uncharacterized protein (TIGR00156 family)